MNRDDVNAICHAFRGETAANPATELDSCKVGGKMFACFGNPYATRVAVKTDSAKTAMMLIDAGAATKAPYFHRSWVSVGFDADLFVLTNRIATSYTIIHNALPKRVRVAL